MLVVTTYTCRNIITCIVSSELIKKKKYESIHIRCTENYCLTPTRINRRERLTVAVQCENAWPILFFNDYKWERGLFLVFNENSSETKFMKNCFETTVYSALSTIKFNGRSSRLLCVKQNKNNIVLWLILLKEYIVIKYNIWNKKKRGLEYYLFGSYKTRVDLKKKSLSGIFTESKIKLRPSIKIK